MQQRDLNKSGK